MSFTLPFMEISDPTFTAWERSFHSHPCEAMQRGEFICGHDAAVRALAQCEGCERSRYPVFLCTYHLDAYQNGFVVYHMEPCGWLGYSVVLHNIERI